MNIRKTLVLGIALAVGIVRADRIVVTQDRESALYAAGEEARFSVSVVDDAGQPRKDGSARWTLDNFGTEKVADGQESLAAGNPFTVTGTLAKPGFLRLKVDSGTNSVVWSVGYDVGAIRQDGTRPSDFDCYWTPDQGKESKVAPVAAYPDGRFTLMEEGKYYWRNRVRVQMERVKALRGKTVNIVFLGDSQTHFMEGRWGRLESP